MLEDLFTRQCCCQSRLAGCFSRRLSCHCCIGPALWQVSSGCWCSSVGVQPLASCLSLSSMQQLHTNQLGTPCSSKCQSNDSKRTHKLLPQILLFLTHLLHFSCEQILIYKNFLFVIFSTVKVYFFLVMLILLHMLHSCHKKTEVLCRQRCYFPAVIPRGGTLLSAFTLPFAWKWFCKLAYRTGAVMIEGTVSSCVPYLLRCLWVSYRHEV